MVSPKINHAEAPTLTPAVPITAILTQKLALANVMVGIFMLMGNLLSVNHV